MKVVLKIARSYLANEYEFKPLMSSEKSEVTCLVMKLNEDSDPYVTNLKDGRYSLKLEDNFFLTEKEFYFELGSVDTVRYNIQKSEVLVTIQNPIKPLNDPRDIYLHSRSRTVWTILRYKGVHKYQLETNGEYSRYSRNADGSLYFFDPEGGPFITEGLVVAPNLRIKKILQKSWGIEVLTEDVETTE